MRVGIVGAGITGLALTHELAKRDVEVATFEANPRPGGVIRSARVEGHLLEYGPQRARLASPLERYVDAFDLRSELITAADDLPLYVYVDGALRRVPRSPVTFLRTDLLSWRGKLRALSEPFRDPIRPDETAETAFRRKFGNEAYRNVIAPLFGGIYGSDPAEMPAKYALDRAMRIEATSGSLLQAGLKRLLFGDPIPPPVSFEDGLEALPDAMYERYSDRIHLDEPVSRIESGDKTGYRLVSDERTVTVDRVVLTAEAPAASTLLETVGKSAADSLANLHYNPLVVVHLEADTDRRGFGYQVAHHEPLKTLGVTFNDSLFDHEGVYAAYLGGMADPDAIDRPSETLGETARDEFQSVMEAEARVIQVTKSPTAFPASDQSWCALDDLHVPEGIHIAANYRGGLGIPKRIRSATGLAEDISAED